MAFKDRISAMFRRGEKQPAAEVTDDSGSVKTPTPAREEERQEAMTQLQKGFMTVGEVLERLDDHIQAGTSTLSQMQESQSKLPVLLEKQQLLVAEATQAAAGTRQIVDALQEHLRQRDEAQTALLEQVRELSEGYKEQRAHEQSQLQLVMGFHRSSRRMLGFLIVFAFALVLALVVLFAAVLLRPDLVGLQRGEAATVTSSAATTASPTESDTQGGAPKPDQTKRSAGPAATDQDATARLRRQAITEAQASADPIVAARAAEVD